MVIKLVVEASKSRSGLHAERKLAFIVGGDGELIEVRGGEPVKPAYSLGEAKLASVSLKPGELAVQVRLVRGLRGRVKGFISVFNSKGAEVYRVVIRKRKARFSRGDTRYHWVIEKIVEKLGLGRYLKKYKLEEVKFKRRH